MKLIFEQPALQKALSRVAGVVASRNTIAILDNIAIDARDGEIWLTATDLVMEAKARVQGQIIEEGEVTALGSLMDGLVRSAPTGAQVSMTFGPDDKRLILQFGRSRYQVPVMPRGDFPSMTPLARAATVTVQAVDLKSMIGRVAFAQSTEVKTRGYLCGVHLHLPATAQAATPLRMVAVDGYRMALADAAVVGDLTRFADVIIPAKAVAEFAKALEGVAGPVTLSLTDRAVVLEIDGVVLRTKVVEGSPVQYGRVLPETWSHEAVVDRQVLAHTVRRIAQVSDNKERTIKLSFADDLLTMQARSTETAEGAEEVEVAYTGEPFSVAFNARYLMDALGQTDADQVTFRMTTADGPTRLEPAADDAEHGPVLSILLPQLA